MIENIEVLVHCQGFAALLTCPVDDHALTMHQHVENFLQPNTFHCRQSAENQHAL